MKLKSLIAAACLLSVFGCKKAPEACFDMDKTLADVGEPIIFNNCSIFVEEYNWEFGDGGTSTEVTPTHSYTAPGEYLVLLTVHNTNGAQADTHSEIVKVGERALTYIEVNAIPADNNGNPWDGVGDPADLQFFMKPSSSGTWSYSTPENTNLAKSVPYIEDLTTSNHMFTRENWDFLMLDNDGATADTVGSWTVDLGQVITDRTIQLTDTNTDITVHYIIK